MSTLTPTSELQIRPVSPRLGAEVEGVDLNAGVDRADADRLRQAFTDHRVLVFRGQHLTPDAHVEAIRIFDEPFDHPTAVRHPDNPLVYPYELARAGLASHWHVGGLWRTPPFRIESLSFSVVPEIGGHTLWADLQAAYDDLSEPFKALLGSVSAVYDGNADNYAQGADRQPVRETVEHPVVLEHRVTGRKGLFISNSALGLTGITSAEGKALLPFLLAHTSSPNYVVDFGGWKPGDFVLWDNLATLHYAVNDYDGPRAYQKVLA